MKFRYVSVFVCAALLAACAPYQPLSRDLSCRSDQVLLDAHFDDSFLDLGIDAVLHDRLLAADLL